MVDQIIVVIEPGFIVILICRGCRQHDRRDPVFIFKINLTIGAGNDLLTFQVGYAGPVDSVLGRNRYSHKSVSGIISYSSVGIRGKIRSVHVGNCVIAR